MIQTSMAKKWADVHCALTKPKIVPAAAVVAAAVGKLIR